MHNIDKNVGIAGYWFATNYGGVASYYSLYEKIEQLGYCPFFIETPYLNSDKEGLDTFPRKFFGSRGVRISTSYRLEELEELNELADVFVLGSDQVLTSSSIKAFGPLFLMEFADSDKRKIAISSSCGGDNLNADSGLVNYAKKQLRRFSAVSVREYSAVELVRNKFGIFAEVIIDPIFFTSKEEYSAIAQPLKNEIEEPYLFAYILDPTLDKKNAILRMAGALNLKVKIALDGRKYTYEKNFEQMEMQSDTLPELDFPQWLYYFSKAAYVFTDSFHGAAMATIMNCPFVMYANYRRGYPRFVTLAKMFGLEERLIEKTEDISEQLLHAEIDFSLVNKILEIQKEKGEKWLKESLEVKQAKLPYYAIESYKNKAAEPYDICPKSACTGCSACMNICPAKCVEMIPDEEGFIYPAIDRNKCVNCGLCKKVCPILNRKEKEKELNGVWAAYSLNNETRYMSTSGGAFTEFAKYVLKMSGVCYGAAYDEVFNVCHTRISSEQQLPLIRQSKYLQSNLNDVYKQVKRDLEHELYVLFSGTPCQCAGLSAFLGKNYPKLIVIDFICHSICSPKAYQYYLCDIENQNKAQVSRVWFKNKETTWKNFSLRIDFKEKEEYYRQTCKQDSYFKAFLKYRVCCRPSCHNCQFKGEERFSDITLADFWGLKWKNSTFGEEQMKNGVSLVMINSEKGRFVFEVFAKHQMYTEEHSLDEAVKGNGGYYNSQTPGLYRDYFFQNLGKMPFHEIINLLEQNEENLRKKRGQEALQKTEEDK